MQYPFRVALLLVLLLLPLGAHAEPEKLIRAPVNDLAGVITPEHEKDLDASLTGLRERTGVQMAVLVRDSVGGEHIEDFAKRVFKSWGGGTEVRNDGVLLVLELQNRRSRLELGDGLTPLISHSEALTMLEDQKPALRDGRYGEAIAGIIASVSERVGTLTPDAIITPRATAFYQRTAVLSIVALAAWCLAFLGFRLTRPAPAGPPSVRSRKHVHIVLWGAIPLSLLAMTLPKGLAFGLALSLGWVGFALIGIGHERADRSALWRRILGWVVAGFFVFAMGRNIAVHGNDVHATWAALFETIGGLAMVGGILMWLVNFKAVKVKRRKKKYAKTYSDDPTSASDDGDEGDASSSSRWEGGGGTSSGGGASSTW